MSRTTRDYSWINRSRYRLHKDSPNGPRDHVFYGRDGAIANEIGGPNNHSPRGFDRWDEHCNPIDKRYAKRAVARINRRRGRAACSDDS